VVTDGVLEQALAAAEEAAAGCLRAQARVQRELRRAQTGARDGQLRELRRAVGAARTQWASLGDELAVLEAAYDVDETAYLADGGFVAELLARAGQVGVVVVADPDAPDRLQSYPSVVRVLAADAAVEVDKKRDRRLRPSVLLARLARAQQEPPRFRPEPFLEAIAGAYDLVVAREGREPGSVVRLDAVWSVLTLLPGARSDYGRPEFTRDLYRLDQTAVVRAKDGRRLRFAASTGTRGAGVLTTVAQGGQQRRYWGVAFDAARTVSRPA
jgi:hypothetical protein